MGGKPRVCEERTLAWHFVDKTKTLGYCDGRAVIPGKTLHSDAAPKLCVYGMHGCIKLIHALTFAKPGSKLCRVELLGELDVGHQKIAARSRKVLWMVDPTEMLPAFARHAAMSVIHLYPGGAPVEVMKYLREGRHKDIAAAKSAAGKSIASVAIAGGDVSLKDIMTAKVVPSYFAAVASYHAATAESTARSAGNSAMYALEAATSATSDYNANSAVYSIAYLEHEFRLNRVLEAMAHKLQGTDKEITE